MSGSPILIGDLGGTHARFAVTAVGEATYHDPLTLPLAAHDTAMDAVRAALARIGLPRPAAACLAVAGPVTGATVRMTNRDWTLDAAELSRSLGGAPARLINDFAAVAHAVPALVDGDLLALGGERPDLGRDDCTLVVLGPGTGLGVAGFVRRSAAPVVIAGEGGHIGFAPETERQQRLLPWLRQDRERVSVERLLSGPGLENLYGAVLRDRGAEPEHVPAAEVFERADGGDTAAAEATALFFEILGQVAGDLALVMGARDGVLLAGGILPRHAAELEASRFRAGFERKGRYRSWLAQVPTALVTHPGPGLLGAAVFARQWLLDEA